MAALSTALNYARSSLITVSGQTAVASQNVANARNADYSRRTTSLVSQSSGSIAISSYDRAADSVLLEKLLNSTSNSSASNAILDGIKTLSETVGDPQSNTSPSAMLGKFQNALQVYEQDPANQNLASNAVQAASDVVRKLNDVNATIQAVRTNADVSIADGVEKINNLLQQFKVVNDAIVRSDTSTSVMADNLDARDKIINQLSEFIGIKTVSRARNDMALYTESGVTLFESSPRTVTFKTTPTIAAGTSGGSVFIDGVDVTGPTSSMPIHSGNIAGLIKIRDSISITYQSQIDEFARGLVEAFAEAPAAGFPASPMATGLFSYSGSPAVPASGVTIAGLSGTIKISAAVDPAQGGSLAKLRDGGINGLAYTYNNTSASGYSGRIGELVVSMDANRNFDPLATLSTSTSLKAFGSSSSGWLLDLQQKAKTSSDLQTAISQRSADALQSKTGVSIDEEMSSMLELERSYQASAKLMTTVDQMLKMLLDVV